jgi:cyclic pyranopterin phosphate synthase
MAAKKTAELIPLCHPLNISHVEIFFTPLVKRSAIEIKSQVRIKEGTGVEMEALTAVAVAALTIYDMAKAIDKSMRITDIYLVEKTGGKSGKYVASPEKIKE